MLALARALEAERIRGVVEIIPTLRQLGICFDRTLTSHARMREAVQAHVDEIESVRELPSRRFRLPVWYDDPWSAEIARMYQVPRNIEFVAEHNGTTVEGVIDAHTGTDFWIACVGFTPGCYFAYPVDASRQLTAPKYRTPRSHTPARAISLAGLCTATYPVASPGGYQLIGRMAVNIYEPRPRNRAFPPDGVLFRAGDRHRYYAVSPLEYDDVWERVQRGEYPYEVEDATFDVAAHLAGAAATDGTGGPR